MVAVAFGREWLARGGVVEVPVIGCGLGKEVGLVGTWRRCVDVAETEYCWEFGWLRLVCC